MMFGVALLMWPLVALCGAHVYERCELARELLRLGVERDQVATWVCIAYHESRFDTAARNPHSGDHGLLQISELYWCGPGKACNAPCSAFRDEDIADDVRCALRIHEEHTRLQGDGFLAWVVYPHHCRNNAKKYLIDCDTSTKNFKFDDRARNIKTLVRNETESRFVPQTDIDKLQPPYLKIRQLFTGNYVNEFERNYYDNKKPMNWINFKINNIDDLKLPNFNKNRNIVLTAPSTTTATRTIDLELVGIKPPTPRKIESNQFRQRMMNLEILPGKILGKNDYLGEYETKTKVQSYASTNTQQGHLDLSHNPFLKNIARFSTEIPHVTSKFPSYSSNYINSFTTTTQEPETTAMSTRSTSSEQNVRKQYINLYTTTPSSVTPRRGKSRYVPQLSDFGYYKTTQRPTRASTSADRTTLTIVSNFSLNMPNERVQTKIGTTKTKVSTKKNDFHTSSTEPTPFPTPSSRSPDTTQLTISTDKSNKSTTRPFSASTFNRSGYSHTTTPRCSTSSQISTERVTTRVTVSSPASQKVVTSREASSSTPRRAIMTEATPAVKSTQSIFDLYLNPTRPTIRPFKFSPFGNSPFKLSIFSDGTTTAPPSLNTSKRNERNR